LNIYIYFLKWDKYLLFLTLPFFSHLKCEKGIGILLAVDIFLKFFTVRKDIDANSEDEVKVKEQAVLDEARRNY
jgi:hypothetical protein